VSEVEALRELRLSLRRLGFFRRPTLRLLSELAIHVAVLISGVVIVLSFAAWWMKALGLLVSAAGAMGVGTNTHTSSHSATSNKTWVNEALTYFGYSVILGLSATYWWDKHVVRHHSGPNMKGVDGDFDLLPWFAGTRHDVENATGWRRLYYERYQSFVFPLAVGFTLIAQQVAGVRHVWESLSNVNTRRLSYWMDAASLVMHVTVWFVIPSVFVPFGSVCALYAARSLLNSYAMFVVFAPAHMPKAAVRLRHDPKRLVDPLAHTSTTLNFRTGRLGGWLCGGLQYQIEHHLLPDISHVYYAQVSVFVQEYCRQHGLPYRSYGWGEGLRLALLSVRTPNPLVDV
jgi:linoleoyl-CoA desaturase